MRRGGPSPNQSRGLGLAWQDGPRLACPPGPPGRGRCSWTVRSGLGLIRGGAGTLAASSDRRPLAVRCALVHVFQPASAVQEAGLPSPPFPAGAASQAGVGTPRPPFSPRLGRPGRRHACRVAVRGSLYSTGRGWAEPAHWALHAHPTACGGPQSGLRGSSATASRARARAAESINYGQKMPEPGDGLGDTGRDRPAPGRQPGSHDAQKKGRAGADGGGRLGTRKKPESNVERRWPHR